jgi:hypothetical protein
MTRALEALKSLDKVIEIATAAGGDGSVICLKIEDAVAIRAALTHEKVEGLDLALVGIDGPFNERTLVFWSKLNSGAFYKYIAVLLEAARRYSALTAEGGGDEP